MIDSKSSYYILANLTRSYDEGHIDKFIPHLIMSVIYTYTDVTLSQVETKLHHCMIIRITDSMDIFCNTNSLNSKLDKHIEYNFSLGYLLTIDGIWVFNQFIQNIFGFKNSQSKQIDQSRSIDYYNNFSKHDFVLNHGLKNVLFVFENLQWFNIKHLFENIEVKVSGGSITRRHEISTTDFNLIILLIRLGYKFPDIYNGIKIDKLPKMIVSEMKNVENNNSIELFDEVMSSFLNELDESSKELGLLKVYFEKEVTIFDIQLSKINLEIKDLESKGNKDLVSKKVTESDNLTKRIKDCKFKISVLDSWLDSFNNWSNYCSVDNGYLEEGKLFKGFLSFFKRRNYLNRINSNNKYVFLDKMLNGYNNNWVSLLNPRSKKKGKITSENLGTRKYSTDTKVNYSNNIQNNLNLSNCFNKKYSTEFKFNVNKQNSLVEVLSTNYKASLSDRISNLRTEINSLKSEVVKQKEISHCEVKLSSEFNNFNKLNVNLDKVLSNLSQSRIIPNNLGKSKNKNNRQYHSLSSLSLDLKRDYSNVNSIKKLNFNIDSPIFIELQRILNTSTLDENTQLKIEQFLNDQGSLFLKSRIDQNLDINYYKLNPSVIEYLKKYISELEKLLDNYRSNINLVSNKDKNKMVEFLLISGLSNEVLISQLLGRLIRIISNNNLLNKNTNCTSLSIDLAKSLLYIFYSKEQKKNSNFNINYGLSNFIDQNYSEFNKNISESVLAYIGLKLLNLLEEVGLIHSEIYVSSKDQKNLIYVCNSTILEYIGQNNYLFSISYKIPMIVKPKPYYKDLNTGKDILGGFLLNDVEYISPLIIKNYELKEQSKIENKNIIFDVINNLSSVGYKINIPVLNFILENGLNYNLFTDPDFEHPLEIKKKQKEKLTLSEKKTLDAFLSRKQLDMNILGLALIFKNIPDFYIPVRIDNRGRIYCMADYLNYQGIELAKSLLLFSKGEKINKCDKLSIDYLKIFGANCYGNGIDKKSYNDRVEWVNNNEYDILNFSNGKLLKDADSKLLFIAFCFEYINYHESLKNNDTFYFSHFPIQLDATCNGYQHLSLLTGDEPLAGQLNLISGDNDTKPNDFYGYVGLKINDYLFQKKSEALKNREENIKIIESCDRLLGMKMNRSLVKLAIMVKPYNAGLLTMIDYIKDNFEKFNSTETKEVYYMLKANNNIKLNNYDFLFFVRTLEEVIYNEFPKLKEFNYYLKEIAQICCMLNITITWVLPSGLNVNQYYLDSEAIRLKPFKFKKNTYTLKIKKNRINKSKQIRALMPNLIHSLDAASLCLIVDMFNQSNNNSNRINFFCIHDCFAVTANNIVNLIKIIKLVYIKIYSEDSYLKRFDQGIIDSIKLQFGNESFNDKTKIITVNGLEFKYPDVDTVILGKIKACLINKANSIIN